MGKTSLAIASVLNDHAGGVSSAFTAWRERRESGKVGVSSLAQKSGSNYSVAHRRKPEMSTFLDECVRVKKPRTRSACASALLRVG